MTGSGPTDEQVADWWRVMDEHRQRGGLCPICRTPRRCWERAAAFAELVAHDLLHRPRPLIRA